MQSSLRPFDIAVLLYICVHPGEAYGQMASILGISKSTAHGAVVRLQRSGLVHADQDKRLEASPRAAIELLLMGECRTCFRPSRSPRARGVPTGLAAAGPGDAELVDATIMVWPSRLGTTIGVGVPPLIVTAPDIALRDPAVYRLMALVDAVRVGDVREREAAATALRNSVIGAVRK